MSAGIVDLQHLQELRFSWQQKWIVVLLVMTPCSIAYGYQHLGGA
jgi:hypothetical protein